MQLLIVIFVALVACAVAIDEETIDELSEPTPILIEKANYTGETHYVTTEDGYILAMHRITGSPVSPAADNKTVIFLMHGLLSSSADWIITGPEEAFGYFLADNGYDVWMGNARGNTYSKNHTNMADLSDKEFWDFSWHEMGIYDLPAMIDYVLEATDSEKLIYVGHSQGTTSFYVMASLLPEYNDKIKVMFSMAPVAYVQYLKSYLLRFLSKFLDPIEIIAALFGINEFLPSTDLFTAVEGSFCSDEEVTQGLCSSLLYSLFGYDPAQLNKTMESIILGHFPAGASTKQLFHYGQEIKSGKFRQYDEGWIKNLVLYGSLSPPSYDLSKVTAPVFLIYGYNDYLADTEDVKRLYSELGNPVELRPVADDAWAHLDFLWGEDAMQLVYKPTLETIEADYKD